MKIVTRTLVVVTAVAAFLIDPDVEAGISLRGLFSFHVVLPWRHSSVLDAR